MHRSLFYRRLLISCVLLMVCFGLPLPWSRLASLGYLLLGLILIQGLAPAAAPSAPGPPAALRSCGAYRMVGGGAIGFWLLWTLTPAETRSTGIPVILLWTVFGGWSAIRLIRLLGSERQVNAAVLQGALAGYLMLGLASGLLLGSLETLLPGSFRGIDLGPEAQAVTTTVGGLNFAQLNYFAFVSLTTVGYGDIIPVQPLAQMASLLLSIAGPLYIAVVMGVLISRITSRGAGPDGE